MSDHEALKSYLTDAEAAAHKALTLIDTVDPGPQPPEPPDPPVLPNVIIESIQLEHNDGTDTKVAIKVRNIGGDMTAPAIVDAAVNIETHSEFDVIWSDNTTIQLHAGEAVTLVTNGGEDTGSDGKFHGLKPGSTYTIAGICNGGPDGNGRFEESSRTDNGGFATVTILGTPPVDPPPTPIPTKRQKLVGWGGVVDTNAIVQNPALMNKMAYALQGWVYMMADVPGVVPDWMINQMKMMKDKLGGIYPGLYVAKLMLDPTQAKASAKALAVAGKAAGAVGSAIDMEPYAPINHFLYSDGSLTAAQAKNCGVILGTELKDLGEMIVYTSSDGTYKGSYNDKIAAEIGEPGAYDHSVGEFFMDGLTQSGLHWTYQDSSFHWGPQGRGDTWVTGPKDSVNRQMTRFPQQHGGIMIWPDNNERFGPGGHFSPEEMAYAADQITRNGNGPSTMYQHSMSENTPYYDQVFLKVGDALKVPV